MRLSAGEREGSERPVLIGHIAVAYFARARWARAELVGLLVATMLPDLADFALPQGQRCRVDCGLFTHAFPFFLALAALAAAMAWAIWHRRTMVILAAALVISHVALDLFTGYKQFWVGGHATGLVLYVHEQWDFVVEALMMTAAWWTLRRVERAPRHAVNVITLIVLLAVQAAFDTLLYQRNERVTRRPPSAVGVTDAPRRNRSTAER